MSGFRLSVDMNRSANEPLLVLVCPSSLKATSLLRITRIRAGETEREV